jgi:hypothetical protein
MQASIKGYEAIDAVSKGLHSLMVKQLAKEMRLF